MVQPGCSSACAWQAAPGALEMVKGCHSKVLMLGHITRTYWPALQAAVRGTRALCVWVPGPMSQHCRVRHKNHPPPGCYWPPGKHALLAHTAGESWSETPARAHLYSRGAFSKKRIWRNELTSPLSRLTIGCLEGGEWRPSSCLKPYFDWLSFLLLLASGRHERPSQGIAASPVVVHKRALHVQHHHLAAGAVVDLREHEMEVVLHL